MSKTITITHSPCKDDETPFSYQEDGFIRWVDEVFQENYKKPRDTPFPTLEQAFTLLDQMGYRYEVKEQKPTACYVYTCKSTSNLQPMEKGDKTLFCADCCVLWKEHDAACKKIGIDPWDETFVVFRAGALAERARNPGRPVEIVPLDGFKTVITEDGVPINPQPLVFVPALPVDKEADERAAKWEAEHRGEIKTKKLLSKPEKLLKRITEVVEPSKLEEEDENYDWNRADLLGILHDVRAILFRNEVA